MKLITHEDIVNMNIHPSQAYAWSEYVIKNKSNTILPPKISIKPVDGVFCNVMPCYFENFGGVKMVTRYPGREPSLDSQLLLLDSQTGTTLALLDANYITALRTGAVCAHSILTFAVENFKIIGMLGLGNTARSSLFILLDKIPNKTIILKLLKYKNQHIEFANRFADYPNIEFIFCDTAEETITDSDVVISSVTYAPNDFCDDKYFKPGVLVVPIHTLGFTNCDLFFDKIYADDYGHVKHFKYFDKFKQFAEVSDVISGKSPGRSNDNERILVYNIGIALQDIYYAGQIYTILNNNCQNISLNPPRDKFWF